MNGDGSYIVGSFFYGSSLFGSFFYGSSLFGSSLIFSISSSFILISSSLFF